MTEHDKKLIRNSTAEFLIFTGQAGEQSIEARHEDETVWLTQKLMATLFNVTIPTINEHLKNIFASSELDPDSAIRKFRITASDGKSYNTNFYNLDAIISVGYRVNSVRATQFRQWATQVLREFAIKGYVLDKKRMGLTSWENAPDGKILKPDVSVAKNYLAKEELESLGRIVNAYLDLAEDRARRKMPMTMEDWAKRLDLFLEFDEREILQDKGRVTAEIAKAHAENEFETYRVVQDHLFESDFDKVVKQIEISSKKGRKR
jgi:hypothetical protein